MKNTPQTHKKHQTHQNISKNMQKTIEIMKKQQI